MYHDIQTLFFAVVQFIICDPSLTLNATVKQYNVENSDIFWICDKTEAAAYSKNWNKKKKLRLPDVVSAFLQQREVKKPVLKLYNTLDRSYRILTRKKSKPRRSEHR